MAEVLSPQNKRSRATQAALLDAAWALLEQSDGAPLTMSAIADASGVSRQAAYLHFTSRAQLFMALFDHVDRALDLESSLQPIWDAPDALASLDAFCDHIARYQSRLVGVVRAVDRVRGRDEDAAALWTRFKGIWYDACSWVVGRLADEGHLAEPWSVASAADLLWALMSIEFVDDLTTERGWTVDELSARLRLLARRTLCGNGA